MTQFVNCANQGQSSLFNSNSGDLFNEDEEECTGTPEECENPMFVSEDNIEVNVDNASPLYFEGTPGNVLNLAGSCNDGGYSSAFVFYEVLDASGEFVDGNDADPAPCERGKWSEFNLPFGNRLEPNSYTLNVWIVAYTASGAEKVNQLLGIKSINLIVTEP